MTTPRRPRRQPPRRGEGALPKTAAPGSARVQVTLEGGAEEVRRLLVEAGRLGLTLLGSSGPLAPGTPGPHPEAPAPEAPALARTAPDLETLLSSLAQARRAALALPDAAPSGRQGELAVWADGSADPNPGQGGSGLSWQFIHGAQAMHGALGWGVPGHDATNNEMELLAAIGAMRLALEGFTPPAGEASGARLLPERLSLHLDSEYVRQGLTRWISGWRKRGWVSAAGQPVANRALWETLAAHQAALRAADCEVELHWVRGHAGDPHNERADAMARRARGRRTPLVLTAVPGVLVPAEDPPAHPARGKAGGQAPGRPGPPKAPEEGRPTRRRRKKHKNA